MLKKRQLATFAITIGLLFSLNLFTKAQQPVNPVRLRVLENFIRVSSAQIDSQGQMFSQSNPKEKSDLFKLHLAVQFVNRQELNQEQKDLIIDSIVFNAPEIYLESNRNEAQQKSQSIQQRVIKLFSKELGTQIFANLSESPEMIDKLKKYQSIIAIPILATRKTAIDKSSASEISFYYKMQMAISLVIYPNLTREQQNLILETMSQIEPELYVNRDINELQAKQNYFAPLKEKILKVFPTEIGGTTFAMIGDPEIGIDEGTDESARCHCLLDSWFSGCGIFSSSCKGGTCNDNPNNGTHCGFAGLWYCNGRCT